jgi:hypothetical protein
VDVKARAAATNGTAWPNVACLGVAILSSAVLSGCSIDVPDPAAPKVEQTAPVLATPTITPGHDAEAVAAKDMPFSAGSLAPGVPVGISDGLKEAPGWKQVKVNVAGESQYLKGDGCLVAAKVRTSQGLLALGDDRKSTVALFTYLDPSILPEYLKTDTLRWGGEPEKTGPKVEVLVLEQPASAGARATAVMARLFGTAESSVFISVSCPDAGALARARADVAQRLLVVPPSN